MVFSLALGVFLCYFFVFKGILMPLNPIFPASLYNLLDFELFIFIVIFCISAYLFYKFFLKNVSEERHESIRNHLKSLVRYVCILSFFFTLFSLALMYSADALVLKKLAPYLASLTFFIGAVIFVKCFRLFVLQYLFLGSMRAGVPLLLVNIFSLLLSIIILFWSLSKIFAIDLTPILATSAAFSIVLGLALQDTLGNLFAGISLQVDKTFELDDWIEVQNGTSKISGQVKELSWRSTVLESMTAELITLPNKLVASSQVSNFSLDKNPIIRGQFFRIRIGADILNAKNLIESALSEISEIKGSPSPFAYISDVTDSWTLIKVIYYIDDFGRQYFIGDKVFDRVLKILKANDYILAHQVIEYQNNEKP
jgi:small-conductance mechanosensitive channel